MTSRDRRTAFYSTDDLKHPILAYCLENCDDSTLHMMTNIKYTATEKQQIWSLPDLFIRQWLNNHQDGFGLKNVGAVYTYLVGARDELIANNFISKDGSNNSGYPLWKNYDFVDEAALRYAEHTKENPVEEVYDPGLSKLQNTAANFLLAGAHFRDFFSIKE
tara:strand:- start:493 stop:978 length:486 start_codon:yes stop_codon:yes gene_type:complete